MNCSKITNYLNDWTIENNAYPFTMVNFIKIIDNVRRAKVIYKLEYMMGYNNIQLKEVMKWECRHLLWGGRR